LFFSHFSFILLVLQYVQELAEQWIERSARNAAQKEPSPVAASVAPERSRAGSVFRTSTISIPTAPVKSNLPPPLSKSPRSSRLFTKTSGAKLK
jgi:hypothetical protein